jgi:Putative Ig domain
MKFMNPSAFRMVAMSLVAAAAMALSTNSMAANYSLELVSPRAAGTTPSSGSDAISAQNRIFRAYPGLVYNIRAIIVGGAYPYTFTLSNAPAGMTIDAASGEINWPNPPAGTVTPTITVRDSEGTERSSPWTITVDTAGFKFVDAANGQRHPTGNGGVSSPWRTLSDIVNGGATNDIVYFRAGTYNALDLPRTSTGSTWERVELDSAANKWIAYPGESPVIDFGYRAGGEPGVIIRPSSENVYIDGFEFRNARVIGIQLHSGSFGVLRRNRFTDLNTSRANLDGSNSSFIMTMSSYSDSDTGGGMGSWGQYLAFQDNDFMNSPVDCALKTYSQWKMLIEDNDFTGNFIGVELKADMPQYTYRKNRHVNISSIAIGGNMHSQTTHGEINFNLVNSPNGQWALDLNQDGQAKRTDVYRNTFIGNTRVRNADSQDGPFRLNNNVIVNSSSASNRVTLESITDQTRVTLLDNLSGSPSQGIVDGTGLLTSGFAQHIGTRGHQLGNEIRPRPPTNVTAQ